MLHKRSWKVSFLVGALESFLCSALEWSDPWKFSGIPLWNWLVLVLLVGYLLITLSGFFSMAVICLSFLSLMGSGFVIWIFLGSYPFCLHFQIHLYRNLQNSLLRVLNFLVFHFISLCHFLFSVFVLFPLFFLVKLASGLSVLLIPLSPPPTPQDLHLLFFDGKKTSTSLIRFSLHYFLPCVFFWVTVLFFS